MAERVREELWQPQRSGQSVQPGERRGELRGGDPSSHALLAGREIYATSREQCNKRWQYVKKSHLRLLYKVLLRRGAWTALLLAPSVM